MKITSDFPPRLFKRVAVVLQVGEGIEKGETSRFLVRGDQREILYFEQKEERNISFFQMTKIVVVENLAFFAEFW